MSLWSAPASAATEAERPKFPCCFFLCFGIYYVQRSFPVYRLRRCRLRRWGKAPFCREARRRHVHHVIEHILAVRCDPDNGFRIILICSRLDQHVPVREVNKAVPPWMLQLSVLRPRCRGGDDVVGDIRRAHLIRERIRRPPRQSFGILGTCVLSARCPVHLVGDAVDLNTILKRKQRRLCSGFCLRFFALSHVLVSIWLRMSLSTTATARPSSVSPTL